MDKTIQLSAGFQPPEPGRFGAELAEATAKVRAFKHELGTRTTAAAKPLGTRE